MASWTPHSVKQQDALYSKHPLTVVATGIQWGKTTVGAIWLKMMMHRYTSPDDNFIITSPTFPIISQSTLPPFLKLMEGLGVHNKQLNCFKMYGGGTCWFRTGTEPDSIVGIPKVRAILADEAGKYSLYFWENIQGRADPNNAPIMIVTSPYSLNWMYREIIRPKMKDKEARPDVLLIQASSVENPHFSRERYDARELTMDPRRFKMMYGGGWDKVDGLVYDCFDEDENQCDEIPIPAGSRIVGGIDWGFTEPFVFKIRAITPDGMHYDIAEVYRSQLTISDVIKIVQSLVVTYSVTMIYCDPSQPAHIEELNRTFRKQGIKCGAVPANNDIRIGIDRHYELVKTRKWKLFRNVNKHTVDELETYHYPAIDDLKPDQKMVDQKPVQQNDHAMDATRYITVGTYLGKGVNVPTVPSEVKDEQDPHKRYDMIRRRGNSRLRIGSTENW